MNQSRPRRLARDGAAALVRRGSAGHDAGGARSPSPRAAPGRRRSAIVVPRAGHLSDISGLFGTATVRACLSAPSTTTGLPSLYSGAAFTWSRVSSSVTTAGLSSAGGKLNALQSTAILRLPTPRKPPKSMTAARTWPLGSTTTSTIRPMFSSAVLRTSLPRIPSSSWLSRMTTAGGTSGASACRRRAALSASARGRRRPRGDRDGDRCGERDQRRSLRPPQALHDPSRIGAPGAA